MENLKRIREKKKVTQVRLSIACEVSQETISAYESGKAFPSVDTFATILKEQLVNDTKKVLIIHSSTPPLIY